MSEANDPVKLAIVYYSSTGNVHEMAQRLEAAGEKAGAEVRLLRAAETAPDDAIAQNEEWQRHHEETKDAPTASGDDLVWADAVLLGSPTRYGNVSSQLQGFIDTLGPYWQEGKLADKVYAGFTSSATAHGGQESTLLSLYTAFHHWGGIIVPPGYTDPVKFADGNPYGAGHVADGEGFSEAELDALDHLVTRLVDVAARLRRGSATAPSTDA